MAMAKAEASPEVVRLGIDGRGQERFSTREMLATPSAGRLVRMT